MSDRSGKTIVAEVARMTLIRQAERGFDGRPGRFRIVVMAKYVPHDQTVGPALRHRFPTGEVPVSDANVAA